uniref:protein-tyrosine-phosphatase n=1 Tax=Anopheles minimus TaxID=112268 RepID=A0A182W4H2_9DIPT
MARHNQNTVSEPIFSSDDEMRESESFKDSTLVESVTILPCRLQMAIMTKKPKFEENTNFYYFSTDEQLLYANFYQDFGPLNLAKLYRYCHFLNNALQQEARTSKTFIHYTRKDPKKILNACFLVGSYCIIYLRFNVQTAMKALAPILKHANGAKYCDASINDLAYLSLKDCLSGVLKGMQRNFFNFEDFNVNDYEYYECVENGDLNWVVPGKLLAFCGPNSRTERTSDTVMLGPEVYIEYFHAHTVTVVVRLNSPKYDAHTFTKSGIQHYDLYFSDGSTPSERLAKHFLKICENARGAIAVHCKAGLGRTGTLIGAYLIKHYQFTAMEAIAWLRICRPGSVIGQQQSWLISKQSQLLQEGELFRQQRQHHTYNPPDKHARGVYSLLIGEENEDTQNAKKANQEPTTGQDSENVQRISQRVDTMCLNDEDEPDSDRLDVASQVNNNVVHCKPTRIKKVAKLSSRYIRGSRLNGGRTIVTTTTSTTTTIRRGRGITNVPPLGGTQQRASLQDAHVARRKATVTSRQTVPVRVETTSAPSVRNQRNASLQNASQGDQLNSIKAARRHHVPTDSIQQKTRSSKVILPQPSTISSPPERHITPAPTIVDTDKGDSKLQSRNDTVKNNNPVEGGTSQPSFRPRAPRSHRFSTKVTTTVNQGKDVTYELSLDLNRVLRLKKGKTYETLLRFDAESNDLTDMFTFEVSINMADVLSGDTGDAQINPNVNANQRIKSLLSTLKASEAGPTTRGSLAFRKESNKASGLPQRATVKQFDKVVPAKLTWLVEEKNRLTFRVSFDLEVMHNIFPVPMYDQNRSATTHPASSELVRRQFETTVTGTREDDAGLYVNFSVKLNLLQMLDKPKMQGTYSGCVSTKSIPQPCSSKSLKPPLCSSSMALETDSPYTMLLLDHNGNDASAAAQHGKPQTIPSRIANTNAETDARPYKRLRVDVSRL